MRRYPACLLSFGLCLAVGTVVAGWSTCAQAEDAPQKATESGSKKKPAEEQGTLLFDGKTLKGWEVTNFGGQGDVVVKKGALILEVGSDLTGIHTTNKKLPRQNYEMTFEAQRVDGSDFFVGLTFPVDKNRCSLIVGGWGGGVCGLSTIDGLDASENDTTTYRGFKNGKWYKFRLRVTEKNISAWMDGEKFVDQDIADRKISIRQEVDATRTLGFASWQTTAALKNIRMRSIKPEEKPAAKPKTKDKSDS